MSAELGTAKNLTSRPANYVPITVRQAVFLHDEGKHVRWAWLSPELQKWENQFLRIDLNMVKAFREDGAQIYIHRQDYDAIFGPAFILEPKPFSKLQPICGTVLNYMNWRFRFALTRENKYNLSKETANRMQVENVLMGTGTLAEMQAHVITYLDANIVDYLPERVKISFTFDTDFYKY